jgi:hypothetical protein
MNAKMVQVGDVWRSPASGHLSKVERDCGAYVVFRTDKGKGYGGPESCGTRAFVSRRVIVERDGKNVTAENKPTEAV